MANLTYRASSPTAPASTTTKTTGLTNADVDGNFKSLDDAKLEKSGGTISGNLLVQGTLSATNTITGSISGNAATVTTNANLTGDVTSVGNATTYTTVGIAKGGTNITSYTAGDVLYASAANTLSKLAKGSDGQVLKLSGGFPVWGTDNDTTYNIGDGALTVSSTAATTNVAITLALSGAYSANTSTARSLDFKVGPALTNLATLMTTSAAGFIRRSGQDTYSVDTSTYSTTSHGHYIGTTAVQSSSADQAVTGILSVTGAAASNFTLKTDDVASAATGILYVKSGDVTAGNASSGAVSLNSGSGFGTQAAGSVSVYSGDGGLTSATGGNVSIQGGGSRAATSTGGNVSIRGGSALSTATTAATGGNVFILGGRTYNATGTRAGGNVYIDGGIDAATSSQYVATAGTVNIGNNASGVGGAGTSAVNIGSTSATTTVTGIVKLPTVGTSGFVKLGTGGQLSADTTTYATGSGTASGTNTGDETTATIKTKLGITTLSGSNTGDQTIPTTLPNANAVTFTSSGGAAAGSTYTGAAVLTVDYSTVGAAAAGHSHSYQAADGDLLAIGGLTGTSGFLKKTAVDTWTLDTNTYLTTYTDTNTTYSHAAASGTGGANLSLIAGGSGSGTDNVLFKSAGATTVSYTDADTITISSTDTTYSLISEAEITAGTATDLRTISGARAKFIADRNVGTATPQAHGTAAVGTSLLYARQDHVHASDNTDTTYSAITAAEITAGTATDLRTITGAAAKLIADRNVGTAAPLAHGTAAVGTSLLYARQDHVHASDNTDTITRLRGTASGTYTSGDLTLAAGSNVTVTQSGSTYTIASSYTDTNTTYSNGTGLSLTGTVFSVNYGTTSTTACVGNDTRLSNAREANGGTATNANNVYVTQTDNTTNYDYSLLLTAGATQNISLRADITGGPTYNPLRNALCLDGFASHIWTYPALQLGRDWSISQDAYSYSFAAGCKASSASAWTGTGNFSKAMRFSLDANAGTFYWYVKPSDTVDTTTSISFRTAMSLDIDGNLTTNGGLTATTGTFSSDITSTGTITSTSDIRVKTNITKIENALDKVEQLNGYTFDRTDSATPRQTGVIAQEVLKVLPEAVLGSEDTAYSVAYGNMMGLMIEAIKELNAKVIDLQNQLANK